MAQDDAHDGRDLSRLEALGRGFRDRYLDYAELEAQLRAWAEAFPSLVRIESLATTPEGREVWLATLGPEPDRERPAVWVDGNMHASEVAGSSVALAIAEDVLRLHLDPDAELRGLPAHLRATVREVLFLIVPRISPDGAEKVLKVGSFVRSVPRDERLGQSAARWIAEDVDGDGLALVMRKQDSAGEYVELDEPKGLLAPRRIEDPPPYYKLYPEGRIEGFDGHHVPTPSFIQDNYPDLNRNFPWSWAAEPDQAGAGPHPGSEPESRAIIERAGRTPHLFAWLNLHTFGGVFIRPRGDLPDTKMDRSDLALYEQLGVWAQEITGYPMVSGFEEFTYEPDKPIHGDLSEWAYAQRGCVAYVCELWDLFEQVGLPRPERFVDRYARLSREDLVALARWDARENGGRVLRPWRAHTHPQLGAVEVGGIDPRFGMWNPPPDRLAQVCERQSAMWLRVAALAPRVKVRKVEVSREAGGVSRVQLEVTNEGYLPTHVLSSAKALPWNEPIQARAEAVGCALLSQGDARRELGHLDGWGRGLYGGDAALYLMRSRGTTSSRTVSWVVRGAGVLRVRVGSCRVGWTETTIEL